MGNRSCNQRGYTGSVVIEEHHHALLNVAISRYRNSLDRYRSTRNGRKVLTMKIKPDSPIYQKIEAAIQKVIDVSGGAKALQILYRSRTETRLVWDMFWATNDSDSFACDLYAMGCNDNHVETMLIRICKQLGLITTQWTEHPLHPQHPQHTRN